MTDPTPTPDDTTCRKRVRQAESFTDPTTRAALIKLAETLPRTGTVDYDYQVKRSLFEAVGALHLTGALQRFRLELALLTPHGDTDWLQSLESLAADYDDIQDTPLLASLHELLDDAFPDHPEAHTKIMTVAELLAAPVPHLPSAENAATDLMQYLTDRTELHDPFATVVTRLANMHPDHIDLADTLADIGQLRRLNIDRTIPTHGRVRAEEALIWFLFGQKDDEMTVDNRIMFAAFKQAIDDSGLGAKLAENGITMDIGPHNQIPLILPLPPHLCENDGDGVDLPATLFQHAVIPRFELDTLYEERIGRWRKHHHSILTGYIPADAGALRMGVAGLCMERLSDDDAPGTTRLGAALTSAAFYLGVPHLMPADYLGILTGPGPDPEVITSQHLRDRWTFVFHDQIPLADLADTPEQARDLAQPNDTDTRLGSVLGCVLLANDDRTLNTDLAWLMFAAYQDEDERPWAQAQPVMIGQGRHPAARYLLNVADVLLNLDYQPAPALPDPGGKPGSNKGVKRQLHSREAAQGGYHGVRVASYRPPGVLRPAREQADGATIRGPLNWGYWRPEHRHRYRIGILDDSGRKIGPVYGPYAVEGVTYRYETRVLSRLRVRDDLPLDPRSLVKRIPNDPRARHQPPA